MRRLVSCLAAGVLLWAALPAGSASGQMMYWAESAGIHRANLDGSAAQTVVAGFPDGLCVDPDAGKIYWTDNPPYGAPLGGRIRRADLNGAADETLVSMLSYPLGIALQPAAGNVAAAKMYWTDASANEIRRADLDGSRPEMLVSKLTSPYGIALDIGGGKMYWTRNAVDAGLPAIQRAGLDGLGVEGLVKGFDGQTTAIALDPAAGKMYWGYVDPYIDSIYAGMIKRSNLDGSEVEGIVSGLFFPAGIALDLGAGKIYWTDTGRFLSDGTIRRADLDGANAETLLDGLSGPRGIALDPTPEPASLALVALGGLAALRRRRTRPA